MSRMNKLVFVFGVAITLGGGSLLAPPQPPKQRLGGGVIETAKVVDLTYSFDQSTIYWPTAKSFDWQKESWGISPGGYWYAAARYAASEHGGTHLDSPIHFAENKATVDQVPLSQLIGAAVVIDNARACEKDTDYRPSLADIAAWQKQQGAIPHRALVLVRTGWGQF